MKEIYVLDACALIAFFRKEEGCTVVAEIFEQAFKNKCSVFIHTVTIAEVYYDTLRFSDKKEADRIFKVLNTLPIISSTTLNNNFIKLTGFYKVNHKIFFADSFVLALASMKKAIIISSDHHEFDTIEKSAPIQFKWIR
jgi:PIN domain nuclease of toxin-antitoxin system